MPWRFQSTLSGRRGHYCRRQTPWFSSFAAYYRRRIVHRYVPLSDSEGEDDPEVKEAERRAEERRNRRGRRRSRVMKYKHT